MKYSLLGVLFLFQTITVAQSKVSGNVFDVKNQPVAYANVIFKNSTEGTITD